MANISKFTIGGVTYDLKDTVARQALTKALRYIGAVSGIIPNTEGYVLKDGVEMVVGTSVAGSSLTGVVIGTTTFIKDGETPGENQQALSAGDVVSYNETELVYAETDHKWHELGSTGSLKALAFEDTAKSDAEYSDDTAKFDHPTFVYEVTSDAVTTTVGAKLGTTTTALTAGTVMVAPSATPGSGECAGVVVGSTTYIKDGETAGTGQAALSNGDTVTYSGSTFYYNTSDHTWYAAQATGYAAVVSETLVFSAPTFSSVVDTTTGANAKVKKAAVEVGVDGGTNPNA